MERGSVSIQFIFKILEFFAELLSFSLQPLYLLSFVARAGWESSAPQLGQLGALPECRPLE